MTHWRAKALRGHGPLQIAATFATGAIGGGIGLSLGLPLGMLLGSMFAVALLATLKVRIGGRLPGVPQHWRNFFVPVIGVAIGAAVPPDVLQQAMHWWPTVLAVFAFVPIAHLLSYQIYRRAGRLDPNTAFFAAMPGGYIEAMELGEQRGADMQMLLMLQFMRLILCIVLVPLSFSLVSGQAVGSASGVMRPGTDVALTLWDDLVLIAAGVIGAVIAKRLRIPAGILSGPLFLSGLAHATGLTAAAPPDWMITMTQWVVATSLGSRFAGLSLGRLWLAMRLSLVAIAGAMLLAVLFALLLSGPVQEPAAAIILAFAPGGVSEMALVAISLQLSAIFVTLHHLIRIVLAVIFARAASRYLPEA